jgi:Asp-tRNA(Asn)/Glu-tRNA(Gln) amidotransferase C subunit
MDDLDKEKIREEAKRILDSFVGALDKADLPEGKKDLISDKGMRSEGSGEETSKEFRKSMFDNAPKKDGDFIIAEKKKW